MRSRSLLKSPIFVLSAFLALLLGFVTLSGLAEWNEVRALEKIEARNEAQVERLSAVRTHRRPLLGPAIPGNAWDDYSPAIADVVDAWGHGRLRVICEESLSALGLDRIRHGARCETAFSPEGDEESLRWRWIWISRVVEILMEEAELRWRNGDLDGAIEDIAAGLQLPLDCTWPALGLLWEAFEGGQVFYNALSAAPRVLLDDRASHEQLERMARLLHDTEEQIPEVTEIWEAMSARGTTNELAEVLPPGAGTPFPWIGRWFTKESGRHLLILGEAREHCEIEAAKRAEAAIRGEGVRVLDGWNEGIAPQSPGWLEELTVTEESTAWAFRGYLRVLRASALYRLGRRPGDSDWPLDPTNNSPLLCESRGLGDVLLHTRTMTYRYRDPGIPHIGRPATNGVAHREFEITLDRALFEGRAGEK